MILHINNVLSHQTKTHSSPYLWWRSRGGELWLILLLTRNEPFSHRCCSLIRLCLAKSRQAVPDQRGRGTEIRFNLLAWCFRSCLCPEPVRSVDCRWLETHWFTGILRFTRVRVQYLWYLLRKLILDMPPFFVGIFLVSLAGQSSGLIKSVSSSYTAINFYTKDFSNLQ